MTSVSQQQETNSKLGKRKKSSGKRGSYLKKWLDKSAQQIEYSTPSMDTYDAFIQQNLWSHNPPHYTGDFKMMNGYNCGQEPLSLPAYPSYAMCGYNQNPFWPYNVQGVNKSIQVQRPRLRKTVKKEVPPSPFMNNPSYLATPKSFDMGSTDFASLPPLVTSTGDTTSNSDLNANEKDDTRRFSDPCLNSAETMPVPEGEQENGVASESDPSEGTGGRLVACLIDQINLLKVNNERLSKELNETRSELIGMRQQMSLWHKGSSNSSIGPGTPNNGLITSTACYSPGMLTDLVREMREAARVRDDALYAHVRKLVDERIRAQNTSSCCDSSPEKRSFEDMRSELRSAETDKRMLHERLSRMEDQMAKLKLDSKLEELHELNESAKLKKELTDSQLARRQAEERANKLEQLVSQLRTKYNGMQQNTSSTTIGGQNTAPPSPGVTTVVLGPVTDL